MPFFQKSFETRAAECEKTSFYTRGEYFRCISDYSVYNTQDAEHLKVLMFEFGKLIFFSSGPSNPQSLYHVHQGRLRLLITALSKT